MSGREFLRVLRGETRGASVLSLTRSIQEHGGARARSGEIARRNKNRPRFYFHLRFVEGDGQSCRVEMPERAEDFAQLITRIKDTHGVSESEIARRIGVSAQAVNGWVNRTRGQKRGPNRETLRKLAATFGIPEEQVFTAAGRRAPGPLSPEAEERIQELYRGLTVQQQKDIEIQMRALAESNRSQN